MLNSLYVGMSQQMALMNQMDIVANNLANMNTSGYKAERPVFQQYVQNAGPRTPVSYVLDYGTARDTRAGNLTSTGAPLDLAVSGDGYFAVRTGNGIRYTRDGHFTLDANGQIVTRTGDPVLGQDGNPILVADTTLGPIVIARDGSVSQEANQGTTEIGQIGLSVFGAGQTLRQAGGNLYDAAGATPTLADFNRTAIQQGVLESSNVQPVAEMTRMVELQRRYQNMQSMMQSDHDLERTAISKLSKSRPASA